MMALTGCSERAVQAVLYGSSYNDLLGPLRLRVSGYVSQKSSDIVDFTSLPFYNFDGNVNCPATNAQVSEQADKVSADVSSIPVPSAVSVSVPDPTPSADLVSPPSPVSSVPHSLPVSLPSSCSEVSEPNAKHYPTLILLAFVAMLPLTLLC